MEKQNWLKKYSTIIIVSILGLMVIVVLTKIPINQKKAVPALTEMEKIERQKTNAEALSKMRQERDDMLDTTLYYDKLQPDSLDNTIYLSIAKPDNGKPSLYLGVQYMDKDWLFVRDYMFKVDGKSYDIHPKDVKRDNGASFVFEVSTDLVDQNSMTVVSAIADSKDAKMRYVGDNYSKDKTITDSEKVSMKNVINAFNALNEQ